MGVIVAAFNVGRLSACRFVGAGIVVLHCLMLLLSHNLVFECKEQTSSQLAETEKEVCFFNLRKQ